MLHTTLLDFTGVLSAGVLAALGFYVLPYRRNKMKADLRTRINSLRVQMDAALTRQFESELGASLARMHEAVAPYTRFVRVEREKLERLAEEQARLQSELARLRAGVGGGAKNRGRTWLSDDTAFARQELHGVYFHLR